MAGAEARPLHVLIAGVTTRALAVSAARAGYRVTALDAFADLDLCRVAEAIPMRTEYGDRYTPMAAAAAAEAIAADIVVYTSNFENYPTAVDRLSRHARLLGNGAAVLRGVRDPLLLMRMLRLRGFATPRTRATPPATGPGQPPWLLKPRRSGGGHGTAVWQPRLQVPRSHYLQEQIAGLAGSVIFAADGRSAVTLGISRQLVADTRFGARGFRYCGSMFGPALFPRQTQLLEGAALLAAAVTEEFGLTGLNGVDFIARNGVPFPIEVNPRYSASMELVERANGTSMFEVHVRACNGVLPCPHPSRVGTGGKAIVFARRGVTMGDTRHWLQRGWLGDVPTAGTKIRRGRPICTVFAHAADPAACHRLLVRRAASIYRSVESRRPRAA